ncbi:phage portal protein [Bariatricus massiliensis]|uniref:Phage portal protein n=1 Tax=Bariatricus massiliensis TaxID=1745713 RepID=A0ABS8DHF2_9FIRM|nr:phage portal protein [Bariatricus massiliensis]MCB7304846.1 phage portal protein [Bariatricus massiliensis]MCB7375400.1 phage portal protein [Bariatricus massiliensis]MCB7387860.1 phage portal protein [Bariatricus massiliensis]MCB7412051.1 phage portal protein [Bariatricus massiliensis]MCQ5254569.1 phage portal protein [Bariatricus massiliensis]
MGVIQNYLQKRKSFGTVADSTYNHISDWLAWYRGSVKKFHTYWIYDGIQSKKQERYKLGMAKKVCEDWANLLLNEKVAIKAGDFDEKLLEILETNNFFVRANQLIEITFALGTGALVEYLDADENPMIDYIRADMIYPLSWDNGDITECAFGSIKTVNEEERIYLQLHRKGIREKGEDANLYYIENKYLDAKTGDEAELPDDIKEIVPTKCDKPLFQIITPNIVNNLELDSPMGISVFANAVDQVKGSDLVYDSYMNEFVLGRKRILVPYSQAKIDMQKAGNAEPVFDPNDTVYFVMPGDRQGDMKPTEVDMSIRAAEHEQGINKCLDLMSLKCGMGTGRYKFDKGGVKTATEVISDKDDLYQNLQKHKTPVSTALVGMVKALYFLEKGSGDIEVTVDLDDSIIEDTNTTVDRNINLVQAGLRSKIAAIMEINKCGEAEAKKELERIKQDNQITGQDIDWTESEEDEEANDEVPESGGDDVDESSGESTGGRAD